MSEEKAATETKKKKGKLPVILMLVVLIGGGGFFGMKMKSGGPKKVVVKAGAEPVPFDKEFLVNLSGGANIYLRAELALELRDDFKKEGLDKEMPAIRNCIIQIFRSKTTQEVGAEHTDALRKEIAEAINAILIEKMTDEEKKAQKEFEKAAAEAKPDSSKKDKKSGDEDKTDEEAADNGWVSQAGPVLNVYFTSFTTQ